MCVCDVRFWYGKPGKGVWMVVNAILVTWICWEGVGGHWMRRGVEGEVLR